MFPDPYQYCSLCSQSTKIVYASREPERFKFEEHYLRDKSTRCPNSNKLVDTILRPLSLKNQGQGG